MLGNLTPVKVMGTWDPGLEGTRGLEISLSLLQETASENPVHKEVPFHFQTS